MLYNPPDLPLPDLSYLSNACQPLRVHSYHYWKNWELGPPRGVPLILASWLHKVICPWEGRWRLNFLGFLIWPMGMAHLAQRTLCKVNENCACRELGTLNSSGNISPRSYFLKTHNPLITGQAEKSASVKAVIVCQKHLPPAD